MKRKPTGPDSDSLDIAALRASLMGAEEDAGKRRSAVPAGPAVDPPSAEDVLRSSPNVVRLCESYAQNRSRSRQRGRTQLVGLGLMVSAILVAVSILFLQGKVGSNMVYAIAAGAAGASLLAMVLLIGLGRRDQRRLRELQGDRLIRAVRLKCDLPAEKVEAFVAHGQPAHRFFECYELWRRMSATKTGLRARTPAGSSGG